MFFRFHTQALIPTLVIACIAAVAAQRKGRSALGWFLLCFFSAEFIPFSNVVFLIVLFILSDLNRTEEQRAEETRWRRRHHARFEEETAVNRNFRDHVIKRLDRQDEVLGLPPLEGGGSFTVLPDAPAPSGPATPSAPLPAPGARTWYLVIQGKDEGPFPEEEVRVLLKKGRIDGETYAWCEGMKDWERVKNLGALKEPA